MNTPTVELEIGGAVDNEALLCTATGMMRSKTNGEKRRRVEEYKIEHDKTVGSPLILSS